MSISTRMKFKYWFLPFMLFLLLMAIFSQVAILWILSERRIIPAVEINLLADHIHKSKDMQYIIFDQFPRFYVPTNAILRVFQKDISMRDNVFALAVYIPNGNMVFGNDNDITLIEQADISKKRKKQIINEFSYYFAGCHKDDSLNRIPKLKPYDMEKYIRGSQSTDNGIIKFSSVKVRNGTYFYAMRYCH